MSRVAPVLICTPEQRTDLLRMSRSRTEQARLVERAGIILACLEGRENQEIAKAFSVLPNTVGHWRIRFASAGISGLHDAPRSGKPPTYGPDLRRQILSKLEEKPPVGQATWDGGSLAQALKVSDHAVWRVLRKEGIQLRRQRSWCVSTDPDFAAKSADIIGLYLSPPERALVISVDEKPTIQAIERVSGFVQTSSGKIVRGIKSTYKRNGTINLFAALNVATGVVQGKTTATKKRADFQQFMDEVVAGLPKGREIHVILDNLSTHKKNDVWLAANPQVHFHFTPTSASWLNQIEIWFGILQRKALTGASFASIEQLVQAITDFTNAQNQKAAPFVWRKREVKGAQLRNTIVNLRN
jgi:transposase